MVQGCYFAYREEALVEGEGSDYLFFLVRAVKKLCAIMLLQRKG